MAIESPPKRVRKAVVSPIAAKGLKPPSPVLADQVAEVFAFARDVIGDESEAMRWMGTPVRDLGYATPVSLIANAAGRRAVIAVLTKLSHGVL